MTSDDPRDERRVLWLAAALSLLLVATPILPAVDFPQHLAVAAQLARLWAHDPATSLDLAPNVDSHNAGLHLVVALLARVLPVELAGRLTFAIYPPLFLFALARSLRALRLPPWRAALLVPVTLGFSFAWGFANFCLGTALSWLALTLVLRQLEAPRLGRAAWLALLSLALGVTHVMAMLLVAVVALAAGIEWLARYDWSGKGLRNVIAAGAPLFVGCAFDLRVYAHHVAVDAGAYTTAADAIDTPLWKKALVFGANASPLTGTHADTALAWVIVAVLLALIVSFRDTTSSDATRARPLASPAIVLLALYFAVPHVFLNTHLVYQRLAQWALAAAVLAFPRRAHEGLARRAGFVLASLSALVILPLHFAWFSWETRGLSKLLDAIPMGAREVGDIEVTRTRSIRTEALTHVASLAVARGALDDGFSFARWMGMPVHYRSGAQVAAPSPSFEHGLAPYDPATPFARRFPWLVVHVADETETDEAMTTRLFGAHAGEVHEVLRERSWVLFDTRDVQAK